MISVCVCVCVCVQSYLSVTPWTVAHQAPLSMAFSRQEYWRWGFSSWVGKIPWRRKWQPTPLVLPGKCHCQSLMGLQSLKLQKKWLSGKESTCQCRRCRRCQFSPWVGKIPWRRKWQSAPVLLPGKSYGQRSLVGYNPWGRKELDMTEQLHFHHP